LLRGGDAAASDPSLIRLRTDDYAQRPYGARTLVQAV